MGEKRAEPVGSAVWCRPDPAAIALLAGLGVVWGLTPSVGKLAVMGGWGPLAFSFWQALGAAAILWVATQARGVCLPPWNRGFVRYAAAQGLFGFAAPNALAITALMHIPASLFAMLTPLAPILTLIVAGCLGLERVTRRAALGIGLGLLGAACALKPGAAMPDREALPWALLAMLCPLCYAISNVIAVRFKPKGVEPLAISVGTTLAAAAWLGPAMLLAGQSRVPMLPWLHADLLVPLQSALMALAFFGYFSLIGRAGAVFASQVGFVILPAGTAWGMLLFGERPGWLAIPAALLIAAGLALVSAKRAAVQPAGNADAPAAPRPTAPAA